MLRAPFQLKGQTYHCSVSIGATIFCDLTDSVDELLKRANLAMNQAKAAGRRAALRFYDPQMQATVNARAELELDMRQGMRQGQFALFLPGANRWQAHHRLRGAAALAPPAARLRLASRLHPAG